jgi:ABC-type multidrug transport system ATPase subunit
VTNHHHDYLWLLKTKTKKLGEISGGKKKHVCIVLDILTDPSIFFFYEPTPGLDSTIALRIIDIAKSLSKNGMTVVMAFHQSSPTI